MEIKNEEIYDDRNGCEENTYRSMYVLRGWCVERGYLEYEDEIISEFNDENESCPCCGQVQTCDVYWQEICPFDGRDITRIISEFDYDGGCNVFPGGVPGPFNPRLVIFVDYPGISKEDILARIRSRIRRHMAGQRTEEIVFMCRHKSTMQRMFGIKEKFGQLVDQWRFIDSSFAPLIEFRDEYRRWWRYY